MKWTRHLRTKLFTGTLMLLALLTTTLTPTVAHGQTHDDIVDVAVAAGSFETLVAAVKAAGLVETLKGDGPFTVFAPTDEAFAQLPAGTVENLLKPENKDQLVAILTYHVVSGKVTSGDLLNVASAKTVNGKQLPIGLRVGDANVLTADIAASNGVIHVIDAVLIPTPAEANLSEARMMIRKAINRGAPLYNEGYVDACTSVYEVTAKALLAGGMELPSAAQRPLQQALQQMTQTHDASERAWIMRRGLDAASVELERRMTSASAH